MLRNNGDKLTRVVVCTPGHEYFNVSDLKAHNINEIADPERTQQQHDRLKSVIAASGCEVIDVPELEDHPNSVFTSDTSLVTPEGHVRLRMGLPTRRGEGEWMSRFLESMVEPCVGRITEPGTVEGGDIILAGSVAFVGHSSRTNEEGVRQLSAILKEMDYEVRVAPVGDEYMHIGGIMSAIGPQRLLCCRGLFPDGFFDGFDTVDISYLNPSSGNVICLGENEVIVNAAENAETIGILEASGMRVHGIDLSEFRKGAGGPTCLTLPLERR